VPTPESRAAGSWHKIAPLYMCPVVDSPRFARTTLSTSTLRAILTDVHFWVPVIVLILGGWLLTIFATPTP
jgi:hypothetical protein